MGAGKGACQLQQGFQGYSPLRGMRYHKYPDAGADFGSGKEKIFPITNYGMAISFARGILERVLSPFPRLSGLSGE